MKVTSRVDAVGNNSAVLASSTDISLTHADVTLRSVELARSKANLHGVVEAGRTWR